MNEDINDSFGELRSLLTRGDTDPRELFWVLDGAHDADPDVYEAQWHQYLSAYSPLKLLITGTDELERLTGLLPQGVLQAVTLSMTGHHLRKWHFEEIAESEGAWFLSELDISHNKAQNHYPTAFAHTQTMLNLRVLNMSYCGLHNIAASWLFRSPFLASVEALNVMGNPLETGDFEALAASEHVGRIERLNLSGCGLGSESLDLLLESKTLTGLRYLDLSDSAFTQKGFLKLAAWPRAIHLEELVLPWGAISKKTRQVLITSECFSSALKDYIFEQTMP